MVRPRATGDTSKLQCGVNHYGKDKDMFLNWAYGTAHGGNPNWAALDKIEASQYAPDGLMFARFKLKANGGLRDAHWHPNSSEFTFIISGTARVTVTGLPKTDVSGLATSSNLRGSSVIGAHRDSETFLLKPGDAFISPVGYSHYFEGVDPSDPLTGIAIFDTADLHSFDTPQVMKNIPDVILERTLSLKVPSKDFYKGSRRVLSDPNLSWSPDALNYVQENPRFFKVSGIINDLNPVVHRHQRNGYSATKVINARTQEVLGVTRFSFAYTEIAPGALLEPYWMDDSDEVMYVVDGSDIEVVRSGNGSQSCLDRFTVAEGYLALNEIGSTWTMTNNGSSTAKILRIFNNNNPSMTTLYDAFHSLPEDVVKSMMYEN